MTRSFVFRILAAFLTSALISTSASAQLSPELDGYTADGASVTICMNQSFWGLCGPNECNDFRHFLTITPCPPGEPCVGGVSQVDFGLYCRTFLFEYGTRYAITGYSDVRTGPKQNGACTYPCVTRTPAGSIDYQVPRRDEIARWRVVPAEAAEPNIWVNVDIESEYVEHPPCNDVDCAHHETQVVVSPCPLAARQNVFGQVDPVEIPVNCAGETATFDLQPSPTPDPTLQLLLAPGEYTVDGNWYSTFGWAGECYLVVCTFGAYPAPVSFNTATLPVRSATWGQIKALYR